MIVGAGALALALVFLVLAAVEPYIIDDTFITLNYARNLVDYGVLTWWPGGEMVDGYTSLGHVLLLAAGYAAGADLLLADTAINLAAVAGLCAVFLAATRPYPAAARLAGLAVILLNAGVIFWVSGGLDGLLYALVFLLAYLSFQRAFSTGRFGASAALASMALAVMRPEGTLVAPGLAMFYWATWPFDGPRARAGLAWTGLVLAFLAGLLSWRLQVYGSVFPNTYYAKASASAWTELVQGVVYLRAWIIGQGGFILLLSPLALVADRRCWLRVLFVAGHCALVVAEGGDPQPAARFFLPLVPLLALDAAVVLSAAGRRLRPLGIVTVAGYAFIQVALILPQDPLARLQAGLGRLSSGAWPLTTLATDPRIAFDADAVRELSAALEPGVPIVGTDVGLLAFYSGREVIDTAGLNNRELAHMPKPADFVNDWGGRGLPVLTARGAPVVQPGFPYYYGWNWTDVVEGRAPCGPSAVHKHHNLLTAREDFSRDYRCVSVASERHDGRWLNFLVRAGREGLVTADPASVEITSCVADFLAACTR